MLISPPFLPPRAANQTESEWIDAAMSGGERGDGSYPVSYNLGWHGGLHLTAPARGTNGTEPVRAIADGTVVYRRGSHEPPPPPAPDSPLSFGGRTSDGVVVIRHETEIGAARQGNAPTRVVFFSIYMHLHTVRNTVQVGSRINRKAELGQAGYVRGQANRIHFEIICDDDNLRQLIGRTSGDVPLTRDGRDDAVFGEIYFRLPASTQVYAERPPLNQPAPAGGTPLGEELFVGLRYAEGDGAQDARGNAYVTTYRPVGTALGDPLTERDAEYNLYRDANAISDAYPVNARPAPSAVYELLRFGRVIGPDALVPQDVPHWRQIRTPAGTGWVNLNAAGVTKYSDADFPHWRGWFLVQDAEDGNSLCNAPTILRAVDVNRDGSVSADEAHERLRSPQIQAFLKRLICKFPTEWDASTVEARWGWLKVRSPNNPTPMTEEQFGRIRAHVQALAFWGQAALQASQYNGQGQSEAPRALPGGHWHFHPRAFVQVFRRCGWLSLDEMSRLIPRRIAYSQTGQVRTAQAAGLVSRISSINRLRPYFAHLNRTARKYGVSSARQRFAHFFAQTIIETDRWQVVYEYGRGAPHPLIPMAEYYAAFYGRGIMQLTWAGNYADYGEFRGFREFHGTYGDRRIRADSSHYWADPTQRDDRGRVVRVIGTPRRWAPRYDPSIVETDAHTACDSGGFYWVQKVLNRTGTEININRVADTEFNSRAIHRINILVNGGGNGYYERQAYARYAARILMDDDDTSAIRDFVVPRNNVTVRVDYEEPV
ncbi:M23 family metallopeptidase [Cupriavidus sp. UGS-1]|uniref:M23 family metallopeptidase n=1 Tax=Cupriavidus sp. UGS-1 TaxID=2899826 RepID=UPI001E2ACD94|nr:M23 family metallopeptidase [Cupriavidus sp. UGS-1]MCD9121277.1 M23 family metallopeptidase [Cupriavidus sp. UGS-1]